MTNLNFFEKISEQLENNINDYLTDQEREEVQTFDDLYSILNDTDFFNVDIIYYSRAMEFLKEHDPSLCESLELADEYDYRPNQLNSELLASLLASEMHREKFHNLEEQINEHLKTVCKWCEKETKDKYICGSCGIPCDEYTYNEETDVDECNNCKKINSKNLCKYCNKETKEKQKFCSNFCKGEFYGISSNSGDSLPIY
tara:strand:+ start:246 stop:845 length:600 start_codon:yes stop_codon:yes gene_type:complete